jgi:hypothetical protein
LIAGGRWKWAMEVGSTGWVGRESGRRSVRLPGDLV